MELLFLYVKMLKHWQFHVVKSDVCLYVCTCSAVLHVETFTKGDRPQSSVTCFTHVPLPFRESSMFRVLVLIALWSLSYNSLLHSLSSSSFPSFHSVIWYTLYFFFNFYLF